MLSQFWKCKVKLDMIQLAFPKLRGIFVIYREFREFWITAHMPYRYSINITFLLNLNKWYIILLEFCQLQFVLIISFFIFSFISLTNLSDSSRSLSVWLNAIHHQQIRQSMSVLIVVESVHETRLRFIYAVEDIQHASIW